MLRWILFGLSLVMAGLGLLTTFKAPSWVDWRLALLAGEFGGWAALVPLAIILLEVWRAENSVLATLTLAAAGGAAALLLKPDFQAARLARPLPARLETAFGPARPARAPYAFTELFARRPRPVAVETMAYGNGLSLDYYRAVGRTAAPCVIVVHSGGWNSGDRTEIPSFNRSLAARGYAVAAIDYRLAPQFTWPAPREDLVAAVAFLRAHAGPLGLDPGRIVLFGRSAGGQIAEAAAYDLPGLALRGVIALYAPADLNFAYAFGDEDDILKSPHLLRQYLGGPPPAARAAYDSASAILHVTPTTVPTLLVHGQLDTLVWHKQSERLDQRLADAGVPHLFLSLPWATHAIEYNPNGPGGQLTGFAVEWFLAAVTK